jgi:hypothetical protein
LNASRAVPGFEDLARSGIEHHDSAASLAERRDRRLLEVRRQRQREVLGVVAAGSELGESVRDGVRREAGQLRVVRELEAGATVDVRGIADDLAERATGVDAIGLAVLVLLVVREDVAVAILDEPPRDRPGGIDHGGVVGRRDQPRCLDDTPVADGTRDDREAHAQDDRDVVRRPTDGSPGGRAATEHHHAEPRRGQRRADPARGGGGGSTPLSERASNSPMMTAFARSDEPP